MRNKFNKKILDFLFEKAPVINYCFAMSKKTPLEKAVVKAGGQKKLAEQIAQATGKKIAQGHVWAWLNVTHKTPAELCQIVEALTGVKKEELRPDVFGPIKRAKHNG